MYITCGRPRSRIDSGVISNGGSTLLAMLLWQDNLNAISTHFAEELMLLDVSWFPHLQGVVVVIFYLQVVGTAEKTRIQNSLSSPGLVLCGSRR